VQGASASPKEAITTAASSTPHDRAPHHAASLRGREKVAWLFPIRGRRLTSGQSTQTFFVANC
jgi:hypothetical protein